MLFAKLRPVFGRWTVGIDKYSRQQLVVAEAFAVQLAHIHLEQERSPKFAHQLNYKLELLSQTVKEFYKQSGLRPDIYDIEKEAERIKKTLQLNIQYQLEKAYDYGKLGLEL